jgi:citrate lyase subunit beta/citryl-CoA lyase
MPLPNLRRLRALLMVPMVKPHYLDRAIELRPDGVVLDLEDSVPPAAKREAATALPGAVGRLRAAGLLAFVRVNRGDANDIAACLRQPPDGLFLPKTETAAEIADLRRRLETAGAADRLRLVAMIETPLGLLDCHAIAAALPPESGLMFGALDFSEAMEMGAETATLRLPAFTVCVAARAFGHIPLGLPGLISNFQDIAALEELAVEARKLGFAGAPVIHPAQIAVMRRVFSPDAADITAARRAVAAYENQGGGLAVVDGRFVEQATYRRAVAVLESLDGDGAPGSA